MPFRLTGLLLFLVLLTSANATVQVGDPLHVEGRTHYVVWFKLSPALMDQIEKMKAPLGEATIINSSNWDGFYATLEVRNTRLFLTSLAIDWHDGRGFTTKSIELNSTEGIFCSWFSGELVEFHFGKSLSPQITTRKDHFYFKNGVLTGQKVEKKPFWKRSL
jgi:hypothetical protein